MRYKKFLIIFALFYIFIGNTESKINVGIISAVKNKAKQLKEKKYDVSYSNDKVIAPGASIIYKGQVYQNEATVPSDALVGIYKDSKYYLYSPSIGKDTLTEINSRRSFGYFLLNRSAQTLQVKTKKAILPKAISYPTTLDTGISVNSTDAINFTFENPLKRWAALKNRTQATKSIFFQPRGPFLELNLVQAIEGGDLIDSFARDSTTTVVANGDIVDTYGSIVKVIPSLLMIKLLKPQLFSSIQNALVQDPDLYIRLNAIEYLTIQIEAIEQIAGIVIPSKCVEAIVNPTLDVFKSVGLELLTNGDEAVRKSLGQSLVNDTAFIGFPTCVAEAACVGVTAGACALVTGFIDTVIDIGGFIYWIIDDNIIGSFDEYTHDAYAEWTLSNNAPIITSNLQLYFPLHQGDWWQWDYNEFETNKGYQNGYWLFVSTEGENSDTYYSSHISTGYYIVDSEGLKISYFAGIDYSSYSYYTGVSTITNVDYSTGTMSYSSPMLLLKNQITVGDVYYWNGEWVDSGYDVSYQYENGILISSYPYIYSDRYIVYSTITILSLNASTTTPAGTFTNCLLLKEETRDEYDSGYDTGTILVYFAPNIGEVAELGVWSGESEPFLDQILSYHTYSGGSGPLSVKTASVFSTQSLTNNNEVKGNLSKKRRTLNRIKHLHPSFIRK